MSPVLPPPRGLDAGAPRRARRRRRSCRTRRRAATRSRRAPPAVGRGSGVEFGAGVDQYLRHLGIAVAGRGDQRRLQVVRVAVDGGPASRSARAIAPVPGTSRHRPAPCRSAASPHTPGAAAPSDGRTSAPSATSRAWAPRRAASSGGPGHDRRGSLGARPRFSFGQLSKPYSRATASCAAASDTRSDTPPDPRERAAVAVPWRRSAGPSPGGEVA